MWEIWDEIDDDGSGHVSFEEFQKWPLRARIWLGFSMNSMESASFFTFRCWFAGR